MLKVEILPPDSAGWVDHAGVPISKLVFSKRFSRYYEAGHYPAESLGSLYRNISDFRESPLQSQTDYEIRIPKVYSLADAAGIFDTVDLLQWLEGINEEKERAFDLIGCEAAILDDDHDPARTIYIGTVISFSSDSIRISDWLGNPKAPKSLFPVGVGSATVSRWPVIVTKEHGLVRLETSASGLKSKPTFYVKHEENFFPIENFAMTFGERIDTWPEISYSPDNRIVTISNQSFAVARETLQEDIGRAHLVIPEQNSDPYYSNLALFRPKRDSEVPDYYALDAGDDMEIVEAWSDRLWNEKPYVGYHLGRPIRSKRRSHAAGTKIKTMDVGLPTLFVQIQVSSVVETMTFHHRGDDRARKAPFTMGHPSQLAENSRRRAEEGVIKKWGSAAALYSPIFKAYSESFPTSDFLEQFSFTVNLAFPDAPPINRSNYNKGVLYISAAYGSSSRLLEYEASVNIQYSDSVKKFDLPSNMDIRDEYAIAIALSSVDTTNRLKCEFNFKLKANVPGYITAADYSKVENIQLFSVFCEASVYTNLDDGILYASGEYEGSASEPGGVTTQGVVPAINGLLRMTGAQGSADGDSGQYEYGAVLGHDAFALRDKLRSLAMESATLIKFDNADKKIIAKDLSLTKEHSITRIGLAAFALAGNLFSFKMESPDRSELASGIDIHWGKDLESNKYAHTLSVNAEGIWIDGVPKETYDAIAREDWIGVFERMKQNANIGALKSLDTEWITSMEAAERMAYNYLRWNVAPMRKAQAVCIFTVINELKNERGDPANIDIGSFVAFDLPGYHDKFRKTAWMVTGRHDDLDSMETTLELLEVRDMPAVPLNRYLLLENGANIFTEQGEKIKMEDLYG